MKKKTKTLAVCCMAVMLMGVSGCGNAIPDMTEEQGAIVAEYAAGLLLKYDKNYTTRLVEKDEQAEEADSEAEAEELSAQDAEETEEPSVSENEIEDEKDGVSGVAATVNIGSFLGLGAVQVDYQGYEVVDSYAEGDDLDIAFAMNASPGAKLVVTKFLLTNTGSEEAACDILSKDVRFRIKYGAETKNALITMLSDDLSVLNTTIPAGESITAVLIIEAKAEEAENLPELSLLIRYQDDSVETKLQAKTAVDMEPQLQEETAAEPEMVSDSDTETMTDTDALEE
ncbi:MAG: hypothetical protein HDR01_12130 [Lachnospiraceae bacterium]|nr:hypothetical protein [Lachnospiraceae bacterium]